jgi:hypothetical protein
VNLRGLAVVTVLLASALTPFLSSATASTTITVLQLNLCHSGIADCYRGDAALRRAVEVIDAEHPRVLSVNEACAGDVDPLRAAMGPVAWRFVAAEHTDGTPVTCRDGQPFGNIVMLDASLAGGPAVAGSYTDQDDENEFRVWACLPAGVLTACTTHLSSHSGSIAAAQCRELMSRVAGFATRGPVVVAGDFNLRKQGDPNVQDCNRSGFYRKGDGEVQHVFATDNLTFAGGTRIGMSGSTDHPGWLVTMTLS